MENAYRITNEFLTSLSLAVIAIPSVWMESNAAILQLDVFHSLRVELEHDAMFVMPLYTDVLRKRTDGGSHKL